MFKKSLLVVTIVINLFSCESKPVSGLTNVQERNDFVQSLREEGGASFNKLPKATRYEQLQKNSLGAAYYYSYIVEKNEDKTAAMHYLLADFDLANAYKERSAIRYALLAMDGGTAEPLATKRLDAMLASKDQQKNAALLFSRAALAFQKKHYEHASKLLISIDVKAIDAYGLTNELDALRALSSAAANYPNSDLLLDDFFLNRKSTKLTVQTFNAFKEHTKRRDYAHYTLYEAMALNQQGYYREAFKLADFYLNSGADLAFLNRSEIFFTEYANLAGRAGQRSKASQTLEARLDLFQDKSYAAAALAIGVLNRNMDSRNYSKAIRYIDLALASALGLTDLDRALWYRLDLSKKMNLEANSKQYFSDIEMSAAKWHNKAYFNDILESTLADLVHKRDFKAIYRLYNSAVKPFGDRVAIADYAWVLAQAIEHDIEVIFEPSIESDLQKNRRLSAMHRSLMNDTLVDPASYAAFMNAAVTKNLPQSLISIAKPSQDNQFKIAGKEQLNTILPIDEELIAFQLFSKMALGRDPISSDLYMLGFFYYGLDQNSAFSGMVNSKLYQMLPMLSTDLVRLIARELNRQDQHLKAIRLMHRLKYRDNFKPNFFDYQVMYPKVFAKELEEASAKHRVNPSIFYGLVRQESGFTSDIISSARAVGLAQIMPASADEFSRKLGMQSYDLNDPATNLGFGAYYINWMNNRRLDGMYSVLMGYNAGPTRANRWMRDWVDLPATLAVEAIPYHETRNYIKNILVSSAIYGYIYEGVDPYVTIEEIYPNALKDYNRFMAKPK